MSADIMLFCDGPMHPSRRPQLVFGVRGHAKLDITVYGPAHPLHSGHYGSWAPNPGMQLLQLLASMRDVEGNILIKGYMRDAVAPSRADHEAIAAMPDTGPELMRQHALARTEGGGTRVEEMALRPAVNLVGLSMGAVGSQARNVIETTATATLDLRLVPSQLPESVRKVVEDHIRGQGFHLVHEPAAFSTLASHPRVALLQWHAGGYPAYRAALDTPSVLPLIDLFLAVYGDELILTPSI